MSIGGLYLGVRALQTNQIQLEVTGQNIANADTEGYTRQRAHQVQTVPMQQAYGQLGTGVKIDDIEQIKDRFLDVEIRQQTSDYQNSAVSADWYERVEKVFNEPADSSISGLMSDFFKGLSDLANDPEAIGVRDSLIGQAETLAQQIKFVDEELTQMRIDANTTIKENITEINSLTQQIAQFNKNIVKIEAGEEHSANNLRDQRDKLLKDLSELTNIETNEQDTGAVNVSISGINVVYGGTSNDLAIKVEAGDDFPVNQVILEESGAQINFRNGEMKALVDARDTNIVEYQDKLDSVARSLIDEVNRIHVGGRGLSGYDTHTSENRVEDTTASLNSAGLDITPVDTAFTLNVLDSSDCSETSVNVSVDVSSDSLEDVRDSINTALTGAGITDVTASIDADNKLQITSSNEDLTFTFADVTDDSSNFLSAIGMNTFFSGSSAGDIAVASSIQDNPEFIAAALQNAQGDNTNAKSLADLRTSKTLNGGTRTVEEFYQEGIVSLGADVLQAKIDTESNSEFLTQLNLKRESISGVNLDEEAANLIKYQRAYEAAARFVSAVDQMLNVLINTLG